MLTKSHSFDRMLLMKRGIYAAVLYWVVLSTGWGEGIEDSHLTPPVVDQKTMEKKGRIVLNLNADGSVTGKDLQALETDEAIRNYIVKSKDGIVAEGMEPMMHLRGETEALFKESRKVIRLAAEVGVTQVVFAAYDQTKENAEAAELKPEDRIETADEPIRLKNPEGNSLIDSLIKPREQDLGMALPKNHEKDFKGKTVFIQLNAQGQVYLGKEKLALDQDADKREMPLLIAELEKLKAGGEAMAVKIYVDPAAEQQRVIDLLNTLAAVDISTVTFTNEIDK